ncbi:MULTISPECIES: hypothetical protein [unclassified Moorena]|uniref:Uncharacterized protein n=1 Tax=Moorena producens 3L TaxID=489825 RepID=F4XML8_9CYAN|nr:MULTISPECIES: hypothetical protein [unclassified Moorena]EGJ33927.1 hypothetical protein LYNGBM3L_22350 [Moorena producens 3L]NEQ05745.1 hypothetical protein [Moorena sp. SIO4E2]NER91487.1 hypothetical protein [Moorena sp. SIO3A2]OLT64929.1 hypothetical protein BI334_07710 [Moorena producens 3L]
MAIIKLTHPKSLTSSSKFDVHVRGVTLHSQPATLHIDLEIAGRSFFSHITYQSIPSWDALWERYDQSIEPELLGALVAWECMRFLALGGEKVVLCEGLQCSATVRELWTDCFRKQLGEWRYLNQLRYPSPTYPKLVVQEPISQIECDGSTAPPQAQYPRAEVSPPPRKSSLLTNGGGKDTLAGMLLLREAGVPFDMYEGYVPIAKSSIALQEALLQRLKEAAAPPESKTIKVKIEDNFFSCPDHVFEAMGVEAKYNKIDFIVGHTANYIGYFPVILYHQYTKVWFNIERSADNSMADWDGNPINHQWCKSV